MWRLKRWWYLSKFGYYHHKLDFGNFFSCDCNWTRTHNHLVRKRTLNHLAKLALKLKLRSKFNHGFTITMTIYKVLFEKLYTILALLTMGLFFGAAHGLGGQKSPLPKICLTYPTMKTLGTVIPYPKKIQKNM